MFLYKKTLILLSDGVNLSLKITSEFLQKLRSKFQLVILLISPTQYNATDPSSVNIAVCSLELL